MTWTLSFEITTARRFYSLMHNVSATRWGIEDLGGGERRYLLGPVELAAGLRRPVRGQIADPV